MTSFDKRRKTDKLVREIWDADYDVFYPDKKAKEMNNTRTLKWDPLANCAVSFDDGRLSWLECCEDEIVRVKHVERIDPHGIYGFCTQPGSGNLIASVSRGMEFYSRDRSEPWNLKKMCSIAGDSELEYRQLDCNVDGSIVVNCKRIYTPGGIRLFDVKGRFQTTLIDSVQSDIEEIFVDSKTNRCIAILGKSSWRWKPCAFDIRTGEQVTTGNKWRQSAELTDLKVAFDPFNRVLLVYNHPRDKEAEKFADGQGLEYIQLMSKHVLDLDADFRPLACHLQFEPDDFTKGMCICIDPNTGCLWKCNDNIFHRHNTMNGKGRITRAYKTIT